MTALSPANEEAPTLGDIARAVNQVHACLDSHVEETRQAHAEAARRRADTSREVRALRGELVGVRVDVATLKDRAEVTEGRVTSLAKMFGAEPVEKGEKPPKGKGIATWGGWKLLGAVSGAFTLLVVMFQLAVKIAPVIFDYFMSLSP